MITTKIIKCEIKQRSTPDAGVVLANFRFPDTKLNDIERAEWKEVFFDSIITEYDARRLYWHLQIKYPSYFPLLAKVLIPWLRDEIDHAYGFALIYSSFTGIPFDQVILEAEIRRSDFSVINPITDDAFKLLIMLAYDEIITTHVYHRSIPKYDKFESMELSNWIRKTKKDEISHFFSFIEIAKELFPERINETSSILEEIFSIDFDKPNYTGTFVLDHNTSDFPILKQEIRDLIIPTIIKKIHA
ncbi:MULTISPECIES: ferritin-like domain-containing protein [unclassified Pseudomonas]|uniref:Ferritin-like domain-containing protein n=1 Tax=Pseudomonas sp. MYb327 TaxID=2745230 RepID=A0AAU8DXT1_9PSED